MNPEPNGAVLAAPVPAEADAAAVAPDHLPFGPYLGRPVAEVALRDPAYLVGLIHAEVGPPELRAAAARAVLVAVRYPDARPVGDSTPVPGRRTAAVLAVGIALAVGIGLWDAVGGAWAALAPAPRPPAVPTAVGSGGTGGSGRPGQAGRATGGTGAVAAATAAAGAGASGGLGAAAAVSGTSAAGLNTPVAGEVPAAAPDPCLARVPGAIGAAAAGDHLDSFQAVAFQVVATKDTGKVTFLNSRVPYHGAFYVAIFPTLYDQFPAPPAQHFRGKCVVAQGRVELYRGTPQLVVQSAGDIQVVDGG
jgi:hypothetical protein